MKLFIRNTEIAGDRIIIDMDKEKAYKPCYFRTKLTSQNHDTIEQTKREKRKRIKEYAQKVAEGLPIFDDSETSLFTESEAKK